MRFHILKPLYVRKLDPNIQRIQTTCDVFNNKGMTNFNKKYK